MEQIVCKNLSFAYPLSDENALNDISFGVGRGEFVVICGRSGCGKTTLLRHLKKNLLPSGKRSGEVLFDGTPVDEMSERTAAEKIGFVMQDPESQIVTDKVWHEMAFSLENLGMSTDSIRLRVAEMASYFGIGNWFDKKTSELSGGQKQLLNLASVMATSPDLLILDEPTSQLDPVAAENFLSTVSKINRDLGTTVIMTEHRLEEVFGYASRVIVMDGGAVAVDCPPSELGNHSDKIGGFISLAMPSGVRIHSALGGKGKTPLSVNESAKWLSSLFENKEIKSTKIAVPEFRNQGTAVEIKNLFFRYDKNGKNILENLSLSVPKNSIFAVTGCNGAGKSTLIRLLTGELKPLSGKISFFGENIKKSSARVLAMPQNPQALFTRKTVSAELEEMGADKEKTDETARLCGISALLDRHPYDLSGGEQQRTALAKLLLKDPDILLLDEPTKGMDCEFKLTFAEILRKLRENGKTVIMISHDIEFCAANADFCTMIFDSQAVCVSDANSFFAGNCFYTTSANKLSRHIFENCVTDKDVISLCRENLSL